MKSCQETENWPSRSEWWNAIRWVLLVYTCLIALTLAGSFVSYDAVFAGGHPWLPEHHCPGCILCGMTRSFCAMSAGKIAEAFGWNRGGPPFYVFGWIWLLAAVWYLIRMMIRRYLIVNPE